MIRNVRNNDLLSVDPAIISHIPSSAYESDNRGQLCLTDKPDKPSGVSYQASAKLSLNGLDEYVTKIEACV